MYIVQHEHPPHYRFRVVSFSESFHVHFVSVLPRKTLFLMTLLTGSRLGLQMHRVRSHIPSTQLCMRLYRSSPDGSASAASRFFWIHFASVPLPMPYLPVGAHTHPVFGSTVSTLRGIVHNIGPDRAEKWTSVSPCPPGSGR